MTAAVAPSIVDKRAEPRAPAVLRATPLIGVLPEFVRDPTTLLERAALAHPGEIVVLPAGPMRTYLIAEPHHVQHVLSDNWRNYVKGAMWKPTRRLMGNGVLTSGGEDWIRSRRLLQSVFSSKNLASLVGTVVDAVSEEAARLRAMADGSTHVDISVEMMRLVQVTFLKTLFGAAVRAEQADRAGRAIVRALKAINLRAFMYFVPQWLFPGERALRKDIATIDETVLEMVRERRSSGVLGNDLLSQLVAARDDDTQQGMDERQLRDELVTLFVAGNDTTAVAMTWIWHVLDAHPEMATKLRAEVDSVLGGRAPALEDLQKLAYTKSVIQETMRLYPVGWGIPRVAEKADCIDGFSIPAGANVLMSQYVTHRSARYWERPMEFDPGRFAPEAHERRPRFAYFPFGGGPRQCLGAQIGMMMLQVMVALVGRAVRMRKASDEPVVAESTITLRPRGGLPMILSAA